MNVKVFNCYRTNLEDHVQDWIASLDSEPVITHTNLTTTDKDWVCFVIFFRWS